jgi:predicted N-acetyltransferase YhbS
MWPPGRAGTVPPIMSSATPARSSATPARVEIRDAGRSDLPGVRRVLLGAYREYAPVMPPAVFGRYLTDLLDLDGRAESGRVLAAVHGGQVVGTVTFYADAAAEGLSWPAGWAGLRALGVAPSARGLGIGRALVSECRRRAQAAGAPVLCLHTARFMTAALALYERIGFRRDPAFDFDAASLLGLRGVQPVPILAYRVDLPHQVEEQLARATGHRGLDPTALSTRSRTWTTSRSATCW